jgi:DNA repair protein RAD57
MTDLLSTLPDFSTTAYTHLIPSFEKNGITVADLLTLDPIEIVKRCPLPLLDVRRFVKEVIESLQRDAGVRGVPIAKHDELSVPREPEDNCEIAQGFRKVVNNWNLISALDDKLDEALGGGIPTGYVTEVTGER